MFCTRKELSKMYPGKNGKRKDRLRQTKSFGPAWGEKQILPCSLIRQYGLHACCLDPRILSPALVREISWPAACLLASDVAQDGALTGINKVCLFMMC